MNSFEWVDAKSLQQAGELLGQSTKEKPVMLKAGGMDLLDLMKEGILTPSRLVNLKTVPDLDKIEFVRSSGAHIGALVTLDQIDKSPEIRQHLPALADACGHAATPQVRQAATLGGNLCQRPRCWYYRHDHFHIVDGDPVERVKTGQNQYHAIFDTDKSPMVQASTPATALIAYGATLKMPDRPWIADQQPSTIDLEKFYLPPKMDSVSDTRLPPGRIIAQVIVPLPGAGAKSAYTKQTERESYDWPICDCAVVLILDGKTVKSASIVMGWVAPTPRRATAAEQALVGKELTEDVATQAARAAVADAKPLSKNAYKVPILETVVRRTIMKCA
jgi:xanthine dehydrogenase YagS FAD-binding subunit